mmetsp:Transcript_3922/g.9364  ORF Transcript_3922/g.9364 Transcript_3922/m.9364 type:complete len:332 (+) Transcript_3922:783-1778(+)
MVTGALNNSVRPRVADTETLCRDTREERLPAGGAVESYVPDDDVFLRGKRGGPWRVHDNPSTGQALAHVIVGIPRDLDCDPGAHVCRKALSCMAFELDVNEVVRQAVLPVSPCHLMAKHCPCGTMRVLDLALKRDGLRIPLVQRGLAGGQQDRAVEGAVQAVLLLLHANLGDAGPERCRWGEELVQIDALELLIASDGLRIGLEHVGPPHHLAHCFESHGSHVLAHLLGHHEHVVDDMFGLPIKLCTQLRVLSCDPHRARVGVALAHHDAAHGDERGGGKAKLLGAKKCSDCCVKASPHLPVCLENCPAAEIVRHKDLVRLRDAELPREAG